MIRLSTAALALLAAVIAGLSPMAFKHMLHYAESVAPELLPISPAELGSAQAYPAYHQPCPTEACVRSLLTKWKEDMDQYYTVYTSWPKTAHKRSDLLPLFADRLPASASNEARTLNDFLRILRPWYPPFLANYTYMLQGLEGYGFETPVGGRGLRGVPKMFGYIAERALIQTSLSKLLLWIPYSNYVALIEWLGVRMRKGDLGLVSDVLYYVFLAPGHMALTLRGLAGLALSVGKRAASELV